MRVNAGSKWDPRPSRFSSGSAARDSGLVSLLVASMVVLCVAVGAAVASTSWALPFVAGVAALIIIWFLPVSLVYGLCVILVPYQLYFQLPGATVSARTAYLLAAILFIRFVIRTGMGRRRLRFAAAELPFFILIVWMAMGVLWADSLDLLIRGLYGWAAVLIMMVLTDNVLGKEMSTSRLVDLVLLGGIGQVVFGMVQLGLGAGFRNLWLSSPLISFFIPAGTVAEKNYLGNWNSRFSDAILPSGTFTNAIDYSVFVAVILVFVATRLVSVRERWGRRLASLLYLIAGSAILLLTLKGTGWLAASAGFIVVGIIFARRLIYWIVPLMAIAGLGVWVGGSWGLEELLSARFDHWFFGGNVDPGGLLQRAQIWAHYLLVFFQHPIGGVGVYNSNMYGFPLDTWIRGAPAVLMAPPENSYLALAVETGVVGLFGLFAFLVLVLHAGLRAVRRHRGKPTIALASSAFAGLVAILAGGTTVNSLSGDQIGMLFGLLLGVVVNCARRDTRSLDSIE